MNIDFSPRQSGKTTRALKWLEGATDGNRILLTFSKQEEIRLERLYPELSNQIFWYRDWIANNSLRSLHRMSSGSTTRILIDNADLVLQDMIDCRITDITLSRDEIELR